MNKFLGNEKVYLGHQLKHCFFKNYLDAGIIHTLILTKAPKLRIYMEPPYTKIHLPRPCVVRQIQWSVSQRYLALTSSV